jgi:hypothetical protein
LQPLGAERLQEHDPAKWTPVFRKDHAPLKRHDPEKWKPVFAKRSCFNKTLERDDDSEKSQPALA